MVGVKNGVIFSAGAWPSNELLGLVILSVLQALARIISNIKIIDIMNIFMFQISIVVLHNFYIYQT